MKTINWDKVHKLSPSEFPENPKYAEPELIYNLGEVRKVTGRPLHPSPVKGALARFSGRKTTQHYVIKGTEKRSKACDVFCEGYPLMNFLSILSTKLFKGIGVYLDTNGVDGFPWVMFHLDIRAKGFDDKQPLIWIVEKVEKVDKYRYPQREPKYWKLLQDSRLYELKRFIAGKTSGVNS